MLTHISQLCAAGAYEETDKTCRECGRDFRGLHWTSAPIPRLRREYSLNGRILGVCGSCIAKEEDRQRRQAEAQREAHRQPVELARPAHVAAEGDDDTPF